MRFVLAFFIAFPLHAAMTRYDVGNPADVVPILHGPIIHLAGGGGDVDAAYQEVIDRLRGCTDCATELDVVVLRASGGDGYNDYLDAMPGVDSVTTFVITDRLSAALPEVLTAVRNAEYVFFAGGDQCNYEKFFNDGPIEDAIRDVYARGGAIGGTSAGMAIQGKAVYDACGNDVSAQSVLALADPYNEEISFTTDFFDWPYLENVITDTHFAQRNRMGRLLAFIARQLRESAMPTFLGIAANEKTAVLVERHGPRHRHRPRLLRPRRPLPRTRAARPAADLLRLQDLARPGRHVLRPRPRSADGFSGRGCERRCDSERSVLKTNSLRAEQNFNPTASPPAQSSAEFL